LSKNIENKNTTLVSNKKSVQLKNYTKGRNGVFVVVTKIESQDNLKLNLIEKH